MQEENKNDVPMVDIDTSGEILKLFLRIQNQKNEVETKEESSPAPQAEEPKEEKVEASDEKPEATRKKNLKRRKKN